MNQSEAQKSISEELHSVENSQIFTNYVRRKSHPDCRAGRGDLTVTAYGKALFECVTILNCPASFVVEEVLELFSNDDCTLPSLEALPSVAHGFIKDCIYAKQINPDNPTLYPN